MENNRFFVCYYATENWNRQTKKRSMVAGNYPSGVGEACDPSVRP